MSATVAGAESKPDVSKSLSRCLKPSLFSGGEGRFMDCVFEGVADFWRDAMVVWREGKTKESSRDITSNGLRLTAFSEEFSSSGRQLVGV